MMSICIFSWVLAWFHDWKIIIVVAIPLASMPYWVRGHKPFWSERLDCFPICTEQEFLGCWESSLGSPRKKYTRVIFPPLSSKTSAITQMVLNNTLKMLRYLLLTLRLNCLHFNGVKVIQLLTIIRRQLGKEWLDVSSIKKEEPFGWLHSLQWCFRIFDTHWNLEVLQQWNSDTTHSKHSEESNHKGSSVNRKSSRESIISSQVQCKWESDTSSET